MWGFDSYKLRKNVADAIGVGKYANLPHFMRWGICEKIIKAFDINLIILL
jgi:hypothetical protein